MKAIIERLEWLEHYIRNSVPVDQHGTVTIDKVAKEIAWCHVQELRAIAETLPDQPMAPAFVNGCICPAGSEKGCKSVICGRRDLTGLALGSLPDDPISRATRAVVLGRQDDATLRGMVKIVDPERPNQFVLVPRLPS